MALMRSRRDLGEGGGEGRRGREEGEGGGRQLLGDVVPRRDVAGAALALRGEYTKKFSCGTHERMDREPASFWVVALVFGASSFCSI